MSASVEKKRRRNALAFAAIFAAFQAYIGHRAQTEHTVIRSRKIPVAELAPPSCVLREHSDWGKRYSKNEDASATQQASQAGLASSMAPIF